jgi:hypothetical protein
MTEYFKGRFESKGFSGSVVQAVHDKVQLFVGDLSEVGFFGQVLPDQAVDLFVEPPLAGAVGIGEKDAGAEFFGDGFMAGEFLAVVHGDSMEFVAMGPQFLDQLVADVDGGLSVDPAQDGVLAFAFDGADHGPLVADADEGIGLPVAQAFSGFDNGGAIMDADAVGDFATEVVFSVAFASFVSVGDAEVSEQVAAVGLVVPEVLVDAFMADTGAGVARIALHASGDLFRRVLLADPLFDIGDGGGRHFHGLGGVVTSLESPLVGLFGPVGALAGISGQFAADGAGMDPEPSGDGGLAVIGLLHGIDFDTIDVGELCVLSHKYSV